MYKDNERAGRLKLASRVDLAFSKHISTLFRNFKWGSFWANLDTTQQLHYFIILRQLSSGVNSGWIRIQHSKIF
jgi:hypothetical protein